MWVVRVCGESSWSRNCCRIQRRRRENLLICSMQVTNPVAVQTPPPKDTSKVGKGSFAVMATSSCKDPKLLGFRVWGLCRNLLQQLSVLVKVPSLDPIFSGDREPEGSSSGSYTTGSDFSGVELSKGLRSPEAVVIPVDGFIGEAELKGMSSIHTSTELEDVHVFCLPEHPSLQACTGRAGICIKSLCHRK